MKAPLALLLAFSCALAGPAKAGLSTPGSMPPGVGVEQKLGALLPLETVFKDATGRAVRLGSYFGEKPVILVMAYYHCPNLCTLVLNALLTSAQDLPFEAGKDFEIVVVSIDPKETSLLARERQKAYALRYGRSGQGWHFLTGNEPAIAQLAQRIGFNYTFDPASHQYAHSSAIVVLTPQGQISRYFAGIEYPPRDLRLALEAASKGRLGSLTDQLFLFCFHYNPLTGKYGMAILNLLRAACFGSVGLGAAWIGIMLHRERQLHRRAAR